MKEWYTAGELAKLAADRGLSSFPHSERSAQRYASDCGWTTLPDNQCRVRTGREGGGGREYHLSLLPDVLRTIIEANEMKAVATTAQKLEHAVAARKVASLPVTSLRFRQRQAMEARGEILTAIERYNIMVGGYRRRSAILDFVKAQEEHVERKIALEKVESGVALTPRERVVLERISLLEDAGGFGLSEDVLRLANDRAGGDFHVSMRTVQRWFSDRDAAGILALAPALTKVDEAVCDEFQAFLTFYARPQKPTAVDALKEFLKFNPASKLTIDKVRYTLRTKLNDIEKNVGREGLLTLRSRMAYVQRSTENLLPTTIYTADGKTFDAEVAHPVTGKAFKPEITSILDVATRKCVGFPSRSKKTSFR